VGEEPIILDDLMSNHYLDLYKDTYGILIPSGELLRRVQYGWFVRSSPRQVMESDTILGNYLLLSVGSKQDQGIIEPIHTDTSAWVSFWRTPLVSRLWGLRPTGLGDHLNKART